MTHLELAGNNAAVETEVVFNPSGAQKAGRFLTHMTTGLPAVESVWAVFDTELCDDAAKHDAFAETLKIDPEPNFDTDEEELDPPFEFLAPSARLTRQVAAKTAGALIIYRAWHEYPDTCNTIG